MACTTAVVKVAGEDRRDHTPTSAVAAKTVVEFADCIGVCTQSIAANAKGSLMFDGVVNLPKKTSLSVPAGSKVYWDKTNDWVALSTAHTYIGKSNAVNAAATTTIDIHLDQ